MKWTADTWCACQRCNGPSLPHAAPDLDGPRELPTAHVQCHACGHVWRPDARGWERAKAMWGDAEMDEHSELWEETVGRWRVRIAEDLRKLERAQRGEW